MRQYITHWWQLHQSKVLNRSTFSFASTLLIVIFFFWLLLTYVPIFWVETKYQTRQFIKNKLGFTHIAQLFIPNFEALNFEKNTKHQDYGIVIPAIYVNEPVIFNVDPNDKAAYSVALKKGIAHASGTAFPDSGGIGYYFAHSSNPEFRQQYNAIFYLLGKLKKDDPIYIWHEGRDYKYLVTHYRITSPTDITFLQDEYDQETIVLQTCWPPGTTQQRLLVFARREL